MILPVPIFVQGFTSSIPEIFDFYLQWGPIFAGIGALLNAGLSSF